MLLQQKPLTTYTLSLSLLIHLALLLLVGGAVVVPMIIPTRQTPQAIIEPTPPAPPIDHVEEPIEDPSPTDLINPVDLPVSQPASEPGTLPPLISVETTSTSIPAQTFTGTPGPLGNVPGNPGRPGGPTDNNPIRKKITTWIPIPDNVSKLGVILDVSGSAHAFLAAAIKEVEKNFDHNPTLLVMGCGMSSAVKSSDVKVELLGDSSPDKVKDKAGARTSLGQLALAEQNVKGLEPYFNRFRKREDVWQVYGGDVNATRFAFEKLMDEGVDTIYWFADFQDRVDPKMMEELTRLLKKKGIRVIAHNFSGKPVPAEQSAMARESGGQTLSLIPK